MTKKEIIKAITDYLAWTDATISIEKYDIRIKPDEYSPACAVYGMKYAFCAVFFTFDPASYDVALICPARWDKLTKDDLLEIYERMNGEVPKRYSKRTKDGYGFYKVWE